MKFGRSLLVLIALSPTVFAQERKVDFDRQIRPILSDNCFACHGPDAGQRKAKLRLDSFDGATAKLRRSGHAIVPGNPEMSRLIERIASDDPSEVMPPPRLAEARDAGPARPAPPVDPRRGAVFRALGLRRAKAARVAGGQEPGMAPKSDRSLHSRPS